MELRDWLLRDAPHLEEGAFIGGLASRLRELGVPLDRIWLGMPSRHPLLASRALVWTPTDGPKTHDLPWEMRDRMRPASAMQEIAEVPFRKLVLDGSNVGALGLPTALWDEGYREVIVALRTYGPIERWDSFTGFFMTVATTTGFDDEALNCLRSIDIAFSASLEIRFLREFGDNVTRTYLGRHPGAQVAAGQIHRGDSTTVTAAIAFADLRHFTSISEVEPPEVVFDLLNDFFDILVAQIEDSGGDVLQFMGDGLLALWADVDAGGTCDAVLAAARAADRALTARSGVRVAEGKPPIEFAMSLHHGDVTYGNMGAQHRLAYTALGPAVNQAARLEAIGAKLGKRLVMSRAFAERTNATCRSLGAHPAKGVGELEVWIVEP